MKKVTKKTIRVIEERTLPTPPAKKTSKGIDGKEITYKSKFIDDPARDLSFLGKMPIKKRPSEAPGLLSSSDIAKASEVVTLKARKRAKVTNHVENIKEQWLERASAKPNFLKNDTEAAETIRKHVAAMTGDLPTSANSDPSRTKPIDTPAKDLELTKETPNIKIPLHAEPSSPTDVAKTSEVATLKPRKRARVTNHVKDIEARQEEAWMAAVSKNPKPIFLKNDPEATETVRKHLAAMTGDLPTFTIGTPSLTLDDRGRAELAKTVIQPKNKMKDRPRVPSFREISASMENPKPISPLFTLDTALKSPELKPVLPSGRETIYSTAITRSSRKTRRRKPTRASAIKQNITLKLGDFQYKPVSTFKDENSGLEYIESWVDRGQKGWSLVKYKTSKKTYYLAYPPKTIARIEKELQKQEDTSIEVVAIAM